MNIKEGLGMWDWSDWAITFFVMTVVAAMLGFTTMTGEVVTLARSLFYVFLVLAVGSFIYSRRVAVNID
jgi:uncharacterized membrane protein YtjA (UPF0391 family)